jgi:hypothetical protein
MQYFCQSHSIGATESARDNTPVVYKKHITPIWSKTKAVLGMVKKKTFSRPLTPMLG